MKSKLIRVAVIVMAMLMLLSVVGCGGTQTGANTVSLIYNNAAGDTPAQLEIQQKIKTMGEEITVLTAGATDTIGCQVAEQRYAQLCGGKVNWVSSEGYSELQQKLASMHMSDEAPDIYPFSNQDYPSILYKGILAPLDDLIDLNNEVFEKRKIYWHLQTQRRSIYKHLPRHNSKTFILCCKGKIGCKPLWKTFTRNKISFRR